MIDVPKAFRGTPYAAQALRLHTLLLVICCGWGSFAVQHIATGKYRIAVADIIGLALTLLASWWATSSGKPERLSISAHLAMAISFGTIIAVCMFSGQDAAMASWYLTAAPLFCAYTLGTRAAMSWSVVALACIALVHLSPLFVQFDPEYVPNERTWFMGKFVLTGITLGLAVASRRATDVNVEALAQRELIIRERARELADARDDALAAVRAKDEFLANMSHEIRTPLNGIIGMTSVLLDAQQPDDQREMVKTIQRSSTALLAVLNEILDYSKLEASAVVLENIPFDLRECIEDAIDLLARSAYEKDVDLYVDWDVDVPRWIRGDITYLRQVLLNLIGNAIKFTEEGSVCVHVSFPGADRLHFRVRDTGIGIPPEKHDLLFSSFSQVDASTTRKYGGTGLGLAISKRLVELMGGSIWVESEEGEGSTFHFEIDAEETEAPARPLITHERVSLIGSKVLLVGGKPGSHQTVAELMGTWGAKVTSQLECEGLADHVESGEVDMIVAFQDALDDVLALPDRPRMVLLVPLAEAEVRARAADGGVEAVVFRPVRQRALRQAMEAIVSGSPLSTPGSFTVFDPHMAERLPARILVGEDNPVNQRVAVTVLEKLGYSPDVATNGLEVLDALERRDFDLLFLDLQMPGMDGLQTAREIRKNSPFDEPWIVALTASVSIDQRNAAHEAGMNDFLSKPFDVQTLMFAIEKWGETRGMDSKSGSFPVIPPEQVESPWEQLRAMFEPAPARLADLVREHVRNGSELVNSIEAEREAKNLEGVANHAHALKSSSAQFGSDRVSALSLQIEKAAKAEDDVDELVGKLVEEWKVAQKRLNGVIEELTA